MGVHAAAEVAPHSGEFTTRVAALKERTSILKSFVAQGTQLIARLQHSRPEALNARQGKKLVAFVSEGQDALNSLPLLESGKIQEPGRIAALETTFEKLSELNSAAIAHSSSATAPLVHRLSHMFEPIAACSVGGCAGTNVSASSCKEAVSQHRLCSELWP
eukprot:15158-Heterococcus_DN1.PRE.2